MNGSAEFADVPSVTRINSHIIITGDNFRYMITIFYKMNILLTCCKNSFAANMTIFRELSLFSDLLESRILEVSRPLPAHQAPQNS